MEWKEVRLGDVCSKIGSGATPSGGKEAYKGGDYHLVRSQNVLDFSFSMDGLASINDEQASKLKNVVLLEDDVLLNITGDSVARACMVPKEILPARVNQHVSILRPITDKLDNYYLLYFLQQQKSALLQLASGGATRQAITKGMLEDYNIALPPLPIQRRIAAILSSLDRKIELNNKINAQLEEMAQAIFKSWFVDFTPFKDGKFVESELGMIPEGWRVGTLGDFGKIICGKTPSKSVKEYYGGNIPFIKIPDMHSNVFVSESEDTLSEIGNQSQFKKLIPAYSLMVSCIATVGLVSINTKPSHTNQQINTLVPTNKESLFYLYLKMIGETENLQNLGRGGTTTLNVNTSSFTSYRIIIPREDVLNVFDSKVRPLYGRIEINLFENLRLAQLRDTLLPKLMSGEIEI